MNNATIVKSPGREYYADGASPKNLGGAVSKSILWSFAQNPRKWFHGGPVEPTPAMNLGSLAHALWFQPETVQKDFAVSEFDSYRTKAAQEWRDEQVAAGNMVVTQEQMDNAYEVVYYAKARAYYLGLSSYEVAVYAEVGPTKVKGMIDIVPRYGAALADLKTTTTIGDVNNITRTILSRGYHWQAAMYLDLWNAASGEDRNEFHIIFAETCDPYETALVKLDSELIQHGRVGYMNALSRWQECVRKNDFPSAYPEEITITLPAWEKTKTNQ